MHDLQEMTLHPRDTQNPQRQDTPDQRNDKENLQLLNTHDQQEVNLQLQDTHYQREENLQLQDKNDQREEK